MRDIANTKQFPVINVSAANGGNTQNYEELSTENAGIGREVPCHVSDFISDSVPATVLPLPIMDFPVITKDDAVTAFRNYVSSKWCWDHSFVQDLLVLSVCPSRFPFWIGRDELLLQDRS